MTDGPDDSLRIDKWLWYARFCKSRSIASRLCASGKLRLNRQIVHKAHQVLRVGDVLTFPLGRLIRVIEVKALAGRRGPAPEAQALYHDLSPPEEQPRPERAPARERGMGRPTKADRRALERLRGSNES